MAQSLSVGVDNIEIERVRQALERHPERFLARIYTDEEVRRYRGLVAELAARFAGKEAVSKVLGTGFAGISWRDIEILNNTLGKPTVALSGHAAERAQALGIRSIDISLSHSRDTAIAFAVGMSDV